MNASTRANHFSGSLKRLFRFQRDQLPSPTVFYAAQFSRMRKTRRGWVLVNCCFHHPDRHPSLALNVQSGGFCCFSCGAKGGNVLDFVMLRDGVDFKTAARQLGAWQGGAESQSHRQERERRERRSKRLSAASIRLERAERECRFSIRAEIQELERLQMEARTRLTAPAANTKAEFCWHVLSWTTDELRRALATYYLLAFGAAKARAEFVIFPEKRAALISAVLDRGYVVDDVGKATEVPLA